MRTILTSLLCAGAATLLAQTPHRDGFTDTPILPGQQWHVHDSGRPHPKTVVPGTCSATSTPAPPPSDAIVLFDGHGLQAWGQWGRGDEKGKFVDAHWNTGDGYFETGANTGDLLTREKFGDIQLHVEWSSPTKVSGDSQGRGNSGVIIMSRYEIQVLDNYNNPTYADGYAGAIYGQWPPLANAVCPPGQWSVYDIVFEAPRFADGKLVKPAYQTVFLNGVLLHNRKEVIGRMTYRGVGTYAPHGEEEPLMLQDHGNAVRYRNIWVRRLKGYDQPE